MEKVINTENSFGFTDPQLRALFWTTVSLTLVYMVVLACLFYNIYFYLYKHRFSKITGVTLFYTFTVTTVALRIIGYIDALFIYNSAQQNRVFQIYWQVNTLAAMFMIAVGFQITKNMYELSILLQYEPDETEQKFKILNISSYVAFGTVMMLEIYLSVVTVRTTPQNSADLLDLKFKQRTYGVLLFFYLLVSCLLISGYIYMIRTLSKFKAAMLQKQSNTIKRVFLIAIVFNTLASLFYSLSLAAKRFVPSLFARDYIDIWTWPVFDLPVITAIMWLHYHSFKQQVKEGLSIVDYADLDNQKQVWTNYTKMQAQMNQVEI